MNLSASIAVIFGVFGGFAIGYAFGDNHGYRSGQATCKAFLSGVMLNDPNH